MTTAPATPSPDPSLTAIEQDIQTVADSAAAVASTIAKDTTVTGWQAFKEVCVALPGMVALIRSFISWVNAVSGNNPQAFIAQLGQAFSQLANAKTQEDHANAAQALAAAVSRLPT